MTAEVEARAAAAASARRLPRRTLVGELMAAQLASAAIVGLVAVVSLWSIAGWVVRDNLSGWARQWIEELDSLGGALYHSENPDRYLQVERYVDKFPEIAFVRYYAADGRMVFSHGRGGVLEATPPLGDTAMRELASPAGSDAHHYDEESAAPLVRMAAPVRIASMASDGLFDVESFDDVAVESELVGFVEIGLDYGRYGRQLFNSLSVGIAVIGVTFLALMLVIRLLLRRAVQPLVDLQAPLRQLADGVSRVEVPIPQHREIAAIAGAVRRAASRVRQRDRRLRRLANFDDLTGLPNRRHLEELVALELDGLPPGSPASGALLFIDLDHFKYINDTLGHTAGDVVLRQIASRLSEAVRETDVVGRFGGDEFIVLLRDATVDQARETATRLLAELADYPVICEHRRFDVQASVGMAPLARPHGVGELLAQADLACHQAKSEGRNRLRVFEPRSGAVETLASDLGQVEKLKRALRDDALVLYFQPIMRLDTGEHSHYEVLVRLDDDGRLVEPGAFLPAAERFGLMPEIDRWVIGQALARLAKLRGAMPEIRFTINVSGATFLEGALDSYVAGELERLELAPEAVVFEITEQVAVGSFADATRQIRTLMALGCEFAIDDFGAGYSSLNYLKQLPMQYIKIDGAFIRRLTDSPVDQVIVRAIAEIARALGKQTVAEFVGSEAVVALLGKLGIDYAQGFHIGRPAPDLVARSAHRAAG